MVIVFLGKTGVHHAMVAAHLFLRDIPRDEINRIDNWADLSAENAGMPLFIGHDHQGNSIYSLGSGNDPAIARKTLEDLAELLGRSDELVVKTIRIRGDYILSLISSARPFPGRGVVNRLISNLLIKIAFSSIKDDIIRFKKKIYQ